MIFVRPSDPFTDPEWGPVGGNEPIPATSPEGRTGYVGQDYTRVGDGHEADGYRADGPDTPQAGSGQGAEDTWVTGAQTGGDSEGLSLDLESYADNAICVPEGELDAFELAWTEGRAHAGVTDSDEAHRAALDFTTQYGYGVDENEAAILRELYLAGMSGDSNEEG